VHLLRFVLRPPLIGGRELVKRLWIPQRCTGPASSSAWYYTDFRSVTSRDFLLRCVATASLTGDRIDVSKGSNNSPIIKLPVRAIAR
jgi:hypothetical protein